jgi:UrcA family protein
MNRQLIAIVSASAFLGAAALPTTTVSAREQAQMRVRIGDLDLQSDRGAKAALRRIKTQSSRFCGDAYSYAWHSQRVATRKCQRQMVALAVSKLDAPIVTAMYQKSGRGPPVLLASR